MVAGNDLQLCKTFSGSARRLSLGFPEGRGESLEEMAIVGPGCFKGETVEALCGGRAALDPELENDVLYLFKIVRERVKGHGNPGVIVASGRTIRHPSARRLLVWVATYPRSARGVLTRPRTTEPIGIPKIHPGRVS